MRLVPAVFACSLVSAVSAAAALCIEDGVNVEARIALGGVAHKPWRVEEAELNLPRGAQAVAATL